MLRKGAVPAKREDDFPNLNLAADGELVFGDGLTDGDWKITRDGNDFKVQVRKSGVWADTSGWLYADY